MLYTLVKDKDEIRIITVLVEVIQYSNHEEVFTKIKAAISDMNSMIVLDLTMVKFMDSLAMGMLIPLLLYTRRLDGDMAVVTQDAKITELFRVLQLDKVMKVLGEVDDAVEYLRKMEARKNGVD